MNILDIAWLIVGLIAACVVAALLLTFFLIIMGAAFEQLKRPHTPAETPANQRPTRIFKSKDTGK